jgi:hypothetical protein
MIEILSQAHGILSISQEAIPKDLQGHTLIVYLPKRDLIVLAGWAENTTLIAELVAEYLELSPSQYARALEAPAYVGMSGIDLEIWKTLEGIYRIRNGTRE